MRIGIDCRLWGQPVGVGRYVRNLVMNLDEIDIDNEYVLFIQKTDEQDIKEKIKKLKIKIVTTDIHWHSVREQFEFPKLLNQENLDLMHFPYFSVPIFYYKPFVVTIHDLIINSFNTGRASTLPYPAYIAKRFGYHAVLANAVYRAKKIIVPTMAVRNDLLKTYLNLSSSKISVTYEGGFENQFRVQSSEFKIKERYLLRVGNFYPHKNVEGLLSAFSFVVQKPENRGAKLVLVGKRDFFYNKIEKMIQTLNISSSIIFLDDVSDEDLVSLYKNATATIVPSFMEGFSLTAVEAMEAGSPVVVSDIPVHKEVCGEAAIYCNPSDLNDIKQKISFAFSLTPASRRELIEQGKKQANKFSWQKLAKETLTIYQNCA